MEPYIVYVLKIQGLKDTTTENYFAGHMQLIVVVISLKQCST